MNNEAYKAYSEQELLTKILSELEQHTKNLNAIFKVLYLMKEAKDE